MTLNKSLPDARKSFPTPFGAHALISLSLLILAFTGGYVLAQKSEEVEWLGWPVVAKPRRGSDAGIYGRRPPSGTVHPR